MDDDAKDPADKIVFISIDFESTGLSVYDDHIVQFGVSMVRYNHTDGSITPLPSFTSYVFTEREMSKGAAQVTGITNDTIKGAPKLHIVMMRLIKHLDKVCMPKDVRVLIGYNTHKYDIPLLVNDLYRNMKNFGKSEQFSKGQVSSVVRLMRITSSVDLLKYCKQHVDTTQLKRRANGTCSYVLGDVYEALLGTRFANAHDALADTQAVIDLISTKEGECTVKQLNAHVVQSYDDEDAYCVNIMRIVDEWSSKCKQRNATKRAREDSGQQSVMVMFQRAVDVARQRPTKKQRVKEETEKKKED